MFFKDQDLHPKNRFCFGTVCVCVMKTDSALGLCVCCVYVMKTESKYLKPWNPGSGVGTSGVRPAPHLAHRRS